MIILKKTILKESFWPHRDVGLPVNMGNHPNMALIQTSELL